MPGKGRVWMTLGLLLLAAALALTGYNLWDEHRAEQSAAAILDQVEALPVPATEEVTPDYILYPEMTMPTVTVEGHRYIGVVSVPALGLDLPVMDQWSEERAKLAPCCWQGSAYAGDLIIAGHNYRSHFGALKNLGPGDRVTFTDVEGHRFDYAVSAVEVLDKTALDEMAAGDWDLTLFTCTYGGQSRLTLRCILV